MAVTKRCSKCLRDLPTDRFYPDRRMRGGIDSWCNECHGKSTSAWRARNRERVRQVTKRWRDANPDKARDMSRRTYLKATYGMSAAQYDAMVAGQGGVCSACLLPPSGRGPKGRPPRLHIDHDHVTGRVRGLLCGKCNQALGLLRDSGAVAARLAAYVEPPTFAAGLSAGLL